MKLSTKSLCRAGIVASLYIVLTYIFEPISVGPIQFRVAEALAVLPLFFVESVPALFIGCAMANIFSLGVYDVAIGSLSTFLAAQATYFIGKKIKDKKLKFCLGVIPPIVINAFCVPLIFLCVGLESKGYLIDVLCIGLGQAVVLLSLGLITYCLLDKFFISKKDSDT